MTSSAGYRRAFWQGLIGKPHTWALCLVENGTFLKFRTDGQGRYLHGSAKVPVVVEQSVDKKFQAVILCSGHGMLLLPTNTHSPSDINNPVAVKRIASTIANIVHRSTIYVFTFHLDMIASRALLSLYTAF